MKRVPRLQVPILLLTLALTLPGLAADKLRLLVISGGHDFQTNAFFQVVKDNPSVTYRAFTHPNAHAQLRPEAAKDYDVMVCYDMWQPITDEAKADFMNFLKAGKGLVILHHAVANYQKWPEYEKILGGRYYLAKTTVNGVEKPQSIWKHDVDLNVRIADPKHPVTRGLKDFQIHDETYGLFDMAEDSHPLLTTDESTSAKNIGWARTWEKARVVYIQLGHDGQAYRNPNYQQLLSQAIRWVAKQD
jgi:uncharacterized protein